MPTSVASCLTVAAYLPVLVAYMDVPFPYLTLLHLLPLPTCTSSVLTVLSTAVPRKLVEAFHVGLYMPYTQLDPCKWRDTGHLQDMSFPVTGVFQARGLDPKGKQNISQENWIPAAEIAVREVTHHHGDGL